MEKRKTLQELTLKDNFLFAAVMMEQENCKRLLELALGIEIDYVEVNTEKSIVYHPEYKGVRLDVFVRDEKNTRFNVEMQVAKQSLEKRTRYYHSQMDMEMLLTGVPYEELPNCYVLFICDFEDEFVERLQTSIRRIKSSREMGERYMLFEEMMSRERAEGKAEGKAEALAEAILEILESYSEIPESLKSRIMSEKDSSVLKQLLKYAVQATTVSEFKSMMNLN